MSSKQRVDVSAFRRVKQVDADEPDILPNLDQAFLVEHTRDNAHERNKPTKQFTYAS